MTGIIIYEGKSRLNGANIVCIATGLTNKSNNQKTGEMIQTWIMSADMNPVEALKNGHDEAVCGNCKYRPANSGVCYVNVGQAPNNIFKSYKKGNYQTIKDFSCFHDKKIRLGSYGDPVALPIEILTKITERSKFTGYTHQWLNKENQEYKKFCMASTDTPEEFLVARSMGWRTFRVTDSKEKMFSEFICPASDFGGFTKTCSECMACNGTKSDNDTRGTPMILVHGAKFKTNRYTQLTTRIK